MDHPIAVRFDEETRFKLHLLSRMTDRSRADLVAEAVRRFVDEETAALAAQGKISPAEAEGERPSSEGWNIVV